MKRKLVACAAAALGLGCGERAPSHPDAVPVVGGTPVDFVPGEGAGYGTAQYPDIVEGGPEGGGETSGSLDVLSLGAGGTLTFEFPGYVLCDGPGPDLLVFENAFYAAGDPTQVFAEPAFAGVGDDPGGPFTEWPCAAAAPPYEGCAGVTPVLASSANGVDPTDPDAAGGDAFDLADLGRDELRYVRLRDAATAPPPPGATTAGADIDAVVALHACPR
jgi:hypothetical protein